MFIREKRKSNKSNPKKIYLYHQLVESVRTAEGPRQNLLLDLKDFSLPKDRWPLLCRSIEDRLRGQTTILVEDPQVERLAERYAEELLVRFEHGGPETRVGRYESVELGTMRNYHVRTVGAEYVGLSYLRKLKLDECLRRLGFSERGVEVATLLIVGRLVSAGSERHTFGWGRWSSGLDELLGSDFTHLSLNSLYRVSDQLVRNQGVIEGHLREVERTMFGLREKIILYDLTNTFFEGEAAANPKARFGPSKEKRSDCRVVTVGLVLDGAGFPKSSRVFAGNRSEPGTLKQMIESLRSSYDEGTRQGEAAVGSDHKATVVIDAGLATEENLQELRGQYHYVCVSRKRLDPPRGDSLVTIRHEGRATVEAQLMRDGADVYLYCRSEGRQGKERGIQSRFQQRFEDELGRIAAALHKKGGTKSYPKVCERIGRAKQKYGKIARYYTIEVDHTDGIATRVSWQYDKEASEQRFSGSYFIRTDRTDLTEQEIWDIYAMLLDVEEAFRTMKSELAIRPNYHQKEHRSDGHIFITLLAYHLLHSIRTHLKERGIHYRWGTLRQRLATHGRVTNAVNTQDGRTVYMRQCTEPESFHRMIYEALGLEPTPARRRIFTI